MRIGSEIWRDERKLQVRGWTVCEVEGCESMGVASQTGIAVCERCRRGFVSVGCGAVYFGGRWHGVRGATYTPEQRCSFPGLPSRVLRGPVEVLP